MEKLRIKITLLAAIIVGIYSFIVGKGLEKTSIILVITIIIFYILGTVSEISITKYIDEKQEEIKRLEEEKEKLEQEAMENTEENTEDTENIYDEEGVKNI